MRTLLLALFASIMALNINAQENVEEAIQKGLTDLSQCETTEDMVAVANFFERVAAAEPDEWLVNYYASYLYAIIVFRTEDVSVKEVYLEKAQQALDKAMGIEKQNSELYTMQGMVYQAYIGLDPMNNGMVYSGKANTAFEFAKKYDPSNPRPLYLQAISMMYTPEEYGGGKAVACSMFSAAAEMFQAFTPVSEIFPNWGEEECNQYISKCSAVAENN